MLKAFTLSIMLVSVQLLLWGPTSAQATTVVTQDGDMAAIARYQATVSKSPGDYEAWFGLGVIQAKQRRFQDAITAFRQVIALQPSLAEPHNNLAVIYNEQGDLQAAVHELEASLKLDPAYGTAYENIGDLYVKLAANAYKRALQKNDSAELKQRYARLLHLHDTGTQQNEGQQATEASSINHDAATANHITTALPVDSDVLMAVEAWRTAWNSRDTAAYFAAYADDFDTGEQFPSFAAWKEYKQAVIAKKAFIRVTLEHIEAARKAEGEFRVTFIQHFRSDSFDSDDQKELLLKQTADGWKIAHEATR